MTVGARGYRQSGESASLPQGSAELPDGHASDAAQQPSVGRGFWTIAQAIAYIAFGNPSKVLPQLGLSGDDVAFAELLAKENNQPYERPWPFDREPFRDAVDELIDPAGGNQNLEPSAFSNQAAARWLLKKFVHDAEKTLVADFQEGRITPRGRPQPVFNEPKFIPAARVDISYRDLQGEVTLISPIHPPSQSWLFVRDPASPGVEKAWRDVGIPPGELRHLHPTPLIRLEAAAYNKAILSVGRTAPQFPAATRSYRRASAPKIHQVITDLYDFAAKNNMKPPNVNEVAKAAQNHLDREGLSASKRHIQKLAGEQQHQRRRLKVGEKRAGKFYAFFDRENSEGCREAAAPAPEVEGP